MDPEGQVSSCRCPSKGALWGNHGGTPDQKFYVGMGGGLFWPVTLLSSTCCDKQPEWSGHAPRAQPAATVQSAEGQRAGPRPSPAASEPGTGCGERRGA